MGLRLILIALVALGVALAGWFYGNARVAKDSEQRLTKTLQEAVQAREVEVEANTRVQEIKRATLDSVRPALVRARREHAVRAVDPADVEFHRLLNDAVQAGNRAIESASGLHGGLPSDAEAGTSP